MQFYDAQFYTSQGGGNCSVPDIIMGKCFQLSRPPTTTLTHHGGKCFWVSELDTTPHHYTYHHVGKCFRVAESGTTPFIQNYDKCMWYICKDTTPFVLKTAGQPPKVLMVSDTEQLAPPWSWW